MTNDQEKIILDNEHLIYMILKKYHLYDQRDEFYDLGMIGLCKGVKSYDSTKNIKISTYLSRCIANEILMYFRKKRPSTISLDLEIDNNLTLEAMIKDESIDIERDLIIQNDFEIVNEIIKSLPDDEKLIINYLFNINGYEKMTQCEIAEYFNISQTQVSRIKTRIIEKIKKQLILNNRTIGGKK